MPNAENLVPLTSEKAREIQKIGARKRHENAQDRMVVVKAIREIMNGKMDVPEVFRENSVKIGMKLGKKDSFARVSLAKMMLKAFKNEDYRAFMELAKFAGMSFEQSPEALGGSENPINISQVAKISAERVKEISRELEEEC